MWSAERGGWNASGRESHRQHSTFNATLFTTPAFTLIELLVVVAIISLLISILLPSLKEARVQAKKVVCMANLNQVSTGLQLYAQDYRGMLPTNLWDSLLTNYPPYLGEPWYGHEITGKLLALGTRQRLGLGKLFPNYVSDPGIFWCPSTNPRSLIDGAFIPRSIDDYHLPNLTTDPGGWSWSSYAMFSGYWKKPSECQGCGIYEVKPFITKPNMALSADYFFQGMTFTNFPNHPDGWNVVYANHSVQWVKGEGRYVPQNTNEAMINWFINLGKF